MIIKSVKLSNIRSYISQEIELPQGAVLLSGDIGSGKSTILLAIEFALFGISKGLLSGEALLRHGKQAGYVELAFDLDGKEVVIKRNLKRLKDSIRQEEGYLAINGVKRQFTAEELRAHILEMLGYPKELLRKSKGLIYRFTVYTPQEEMKRILFDDPQVRLDTLRRVFQIEKYKLVREGAAVVMQALREKKKELSARIEDLLEKKQQLGELSGELGTAEKKLAALAPIIGKTEQLLQQKNASLKSLEEKAKQVSDLKSQLAAVSAVISEKKSSMASKEAEIAASKEEITGLKLQLKDNSALVGLLSSGLSKLKSLSDSLLKDIEAKSPLEAELLVAEQLRSEAESEISRNEALKSSSQQLQRKISELANCPTCLQPVSGEHKHKISAEEQSKVAGLTLKLTAASGKRAEALQKIVFVKKGLNDLVAKEKFAASLNAELKPYFELASTFGAEIEQLSSQPQSFTSSASVAAVEKELNSLALAKKQLESSRERLLVASEKERLIELAEKAIGSLRKEGKLLEEKKAELSARLASFGDIEAEIGALQAGLDTLIREKTSVMMQKASLEKEKENVASQIRQLSEEIGKKEAAKRELDQANNLNYWFEEMFVSLVDVIERHVMMKVNQEFNGLFKEWFTLLMGNENLSARIDEDFTPIVEADGFEIPVENLSGGEKTSCALAYRLALNKVINDLVSTIKTKDVLILDEPTDGFSTEQLDKLRDVLAQLNLPQVIIVSHEELIESFVQHVIRIQKEQHISKVIA